MVRKIRIRRKGYWRKPFIARRGRTVYKVKRTYIPPTTFFRKDIGAPGRGRRVIKRIRKGRLLRIGYSTKKSVAQRHRALDRAVKKYGAGTTWRMLHAQVIFRKRLPNGAKRKFKADRAYIKRKYKPDIAGPARRRWMEMTPKARAKAMPGG